MLARQAAVSELPWARNCGNRFLLFTMERDWGSAECPGSSGFLLLSKNGSGFVARWLKKSLGRNRAKPTITRNKMYGFSGRQSACDRGSPAMPVSSQVPDVGIGRQLRFDSSGGHKSRVWDAEHEGFLVMYLWQQLLGKLHLILKSD